MGEGGVFGREGGVFGREEGVEEQREKSVGTNSGGVYSGRVGEAERVQMVVGIEIRDSRLSGLRSTRGRYFCVYQVVCKVPCTGGCVRDTYNFCLVLCTSPD